MEELLIVSLDWDLRGNILTIAGLIEPASFSWVGQWSGC